MEVSIHGGSPKMVGCFQARCPPCAVLKVLSQPLLAAITKWHLDAQSGLHFEIRSLQIRPKSCMDPLPGMADFSQESVQWLRCAGISLLGVSVAALGRCWEGNPLGAANDFFSVFFGLGLFQDDLWQLFGGRGDEEELCTISARGSNCLLPFGLLSIINAVFDIMTVAVVCVDCFVSVQQALSTLCSGCFFTFGAAIFQACAAFIAWQIYRGRPQNAGYSLVPAGAKEIPMDEHALGGRTGLGQSRLTWMKHWAKRQCSISSVKYCILFIRENPIKMDDWGVPLFQEATISMISTCNNICLACHHVQDFDLNPLFLELLPGEFTFQDQALVSMVAAYFGLFRMHLVFSGNCLETCIRQWT